jgi:hypothetical protein
MRPSHDRALVLLGVSWHRFRYVVKLKLQHISQKGFDFSIEVSVLDVQEDPPIDVVLHVPFLDGD